MNNKKGFTLMELLATIVLLSLIALISVPIMSKIIESSQKTSFKNNAQALLNLVKLDRENSGYNVNLPVAQYMINSDTNKIYYDGQPISIDFNGKIKGNGVIYIDSDSNTAITYSDNKYCAYKRFNDQKIEVEKGSCNTDEIFQCNDYNIGMIFTPNIDIWSQNKIVNIVYLGGNSCKNVYYKLNEEDDFLPYSDKIIIDSAISKMYLLLENSILDTTNVEVPISHIDVTPPNLILRTTSSYGALNVIVTATDNESGIYGFRVSYDNGYSWTNIISLPETGTERITFKGLPAGTYNILAEVYNNAWNNTPTSPVNLRNDSQGITISEEPVATIVNQCLNPVISFPNNDGNTWTQTKEITIDYGNDELCDGTYKIIDNATNQIIEEGTGTTLTISNNNVTIVAQNTYNNSENIDGLEVNVSDQSYNVSTTLQTVNTIDSSAPVIEQISTTETSKNIVLTITATDEESDITSVKCYYGENYGTEVIGQKQSGNGYTCTFSNYLTPGTPYNYKVVVTNEPGMTKEQVGTATTAAFGQISATFNPGQNEPSSSKTVTLSGTTAGANLQYTLGTSTNWIDYTSPFVISENTTINVRFNDGVNTSDITTFTITTIQRPASEITYGNTNVQAAIEDLYDQLENL